MALSCPHCGHSISIKDVKAGSYKPKCPKCAERFALTVSEDPSVLPIAAKIASAPASATVAEATMAPSASIAPKPVSPPAEATTLNATMVNATMPPKSGAASVTKPGIQATIPSRGAEATEAGNSQATRVEPFAGSGPGSHIPAVIGGYRILRELGRGAMGSVYLAKQISLDRNVALKTIQAQWADNPTFVARFTREAYAAAQLSHHNVVQIYDLGTSNDINFFSMEYVQGESLDDLIKRDGKLDVEVAVGYVLQAARGLQFAHNHGMVHRDVKPANLILSNQGIVKVADLGLVKTPQVSEGESAAGGALPEENKVGMSGSLAAARADVTLANVAMGTPAYMAPEQGTNAAGVDHRADIYSLGCTLYVLLTGRPPFEGATGDGSHHQAQDGTGRSTRSDCQTGPPALSGDNAEDGGQEPRRPLRQFGRSDWWLLKAFLEFSQAARSPPRKNTQALEESLAQFLNGASGASCVLLRRWRLLRGHWR
ncbi:MAG: protein kinase [Pirellulales bacterium]